MKKGFTLIELLVVIAIIGLLSAVVLISLNSARVKARDAKRKTDLGQIQLALEMYYDKNGQYPGEAGWCDSSKGVTAADCAGFVGSSWPAGGLINIQTDGLIGAMPIDPTNNTDFYYYYEPVCNQTQFNTTCGSTCCGYQISTNLENDSDPQRNPAQCPVSGISPAGLQDYCLRGGAATF